jgi:hypothetical protein
MGVFKKSMSKIAGSILLVLPCLVLVACAGSSPYMKAVEPAVGPGVAPRDLAVVRFMRPSGFGFAVNFNILDGEKVIGNSVAKSQFDYLTAPGHHLFVATAENKAFLEADLEAGRTYYVITRIYPGALYARVAFLPVVKDSELWADIPRYEHELQRLRPDNEALAKWEMENKGKISAVLAQYESEWKSKYQWPRLVPEDGR